MMKKDWRKFLRIKTRIRQKQQQQKHTNDDDDKILLIVKVLSKEIFFQDVFLSFWKRFNHLVSRIIFSSSLIRLYISLNDHHMVV